MMRCRLPRLLALIGCAMIVGAAEPRAQTTNRQEFQRYEQKQWEDSKRAEAEALEQQRRLRQQIQQDQLFRQRLENERRVQQLNQDRLRRNLDEDPAYGDPYVAPGQIYQQPAPLYVAPGQPGAVIVAPQTACRQFAPGYDSNGAYLGQICVR